MLYSLIAYGLLEINYQVARTCFRLLYTPQNAPSPPKPDIPCVPNIPQAPYLCWGLQIFIQDLLDRGGVCRVHNQFCHVFPANGIQNGSVILP